eukprot:augustus_masked-scaffold_4-processed-gene-11.14-mRNA-1 protein AED:0.63 eAED:0.63 QI:0/-1/0/1/-1/1/1/0/203
MPKFSLSEHTSQRKGFPSAVKLSVDILEGLKRNSGSMLKVESTVGSGKNEGMSALFQVAKEALGELPPVELEEKVHMPSHGHNLRKKKRSFSSLVVETKVMKPKFRGKRSNRFGKRMKSKRRAISLDTARVLEYSGLDAGGYNPEEREKALERFIEKRRKRNWKKVVKYPVRKTFADSRMRVKGRFISKKDEKVIVDGLVILM